MRSRCRVLAAWTAIVAVCLSGCAKSAAEEDHDRIRRLLDTYLLSVKTADVALASSLRELLPKAFLERDLKPSNVHIDVNGDSAWAVFDWSFTAKLANGQPFTSKGWESHVYRKTDGGWRIAHLHYSGQMPQSQ